MRKRWGRPTLFNWKWTAPPKSWGARPRGWKPRPSAYAPKSRGFVASGGRRRRTTIRVGSPPPSQGWVTRPKRRLRRRHFWAIIALVFLFATIQSFLFLDRYLREPLMFLAKVRITQMATEAINAAITDNIAAGADSSKMVNWQTDERGKTTGFLIDYKEQMKITAETVRVVDAALKAQEAVHERIPIGHAIDSPFLSSLGPTVAVRFHPLSTVQAEVKTRQSSAGINMLLVEVYIHVKTDISIVIPFDREPNTIETDIPLSYLLVVGDTPMYYYDGKGNPVGSGASQAPALTLPNPSQGANAAPGEGAAGSGGGRTEKPSGSEAVSGQSAGAGAGH
ncbi:sporulation protein YunB [Cohnella nanjingensis]|uniref:Sporulation protein YunB n=1 Tax=Cohnella nanjingensis TaxID=1387779 RepID=A0A7X0RRV9_9BACL|nr:sporulation protein YunB [Cohnella nanjingensis]MBB6672512.1 sporulation protein YunB [Cohnella nanjingensis]